VGRHVGLVSDRGIPLTRDMDTYQGLKANLDITLKRAELCCFTKRRQRMMTIWNYIFCMVKTNSIIRPCNLNFLYGLRPSR